jgi:hypothetical protein
LERLRAVGRLFVFAVACGNLSVVYPAWSQNALLGSLSTEVVGGTSGTGDKLTEVPKFSQGFAPRVHLDLSGNPCLLVSPLVNAQIVSRNIYDHILLLDNHCSKEIKLRACYLGSENCKMMSIGAYKRGQQTLGVFPSREFRYSYREYIE